MALLLIVDPLSASSSRQIAHSREDGEDCTDRSGHIAATRPHLVMLTCFPVLSWSSWSPHAVQQICDSSMHEPSVLARHMSLGSPGAPRARLVCVSHHLRALTTCSHICTDPQEIEVNLLQLHVSKTNNATSLPVSTLPKKTQHTCIHITLMKQTNPIFTNRHIP